MLNASFRDPSGFLFTHGGTLYRQVNRSYQADYDRLMTSGLYQELTSAGLMIPHREVAEGEVETPWQTLTPYKIIQPELLDFVSYPYEWCFSQLKDAALTTMAIQKRALASGMSLKDSSVYNIQFHHGHPLLIDSLSFEIYQEGKPWDAYRQFCQHFLAPLSLMAYRDARLGQLLRAHLDGVPLDLASKLLPPGTRLKMPLFLHIHLHASSQKRYAGRAIAQETRKVSKSAFLGLIDSLEAGVRGLQWSPEGTEWGDYYEATNYTEQGLAHKKALVQEYLNFIHPRRVWDLGANTGLFSRLASNQGIFTLSCDIDPGAVELNYRECKRNKETHLLPLLQDLTNPSPGIGWNNQERQSLLERGPADAVLALALVHHLAISNNTPLDRLATFFQQFGRWLIIEFVPKEDSQVQRLLSSRKDIFSDYDVSGFENAFSQKYKIHRAEAVQDSKRRLYLMESLPVGLNG